MRPAGLKPAVSLDAAECNSAGRTDREVMFLHAHSGAQYFNVLLAVLFSISSNRTHSSAIASKSFRLPVAFLMRNQRNLCWWRKRKKRSRLSSPLTSFEAQRLGCCPRCSQPVTNDQP